jgi:hypothetical protein
MVEPSKSVPVKHLSNFVRTTPSCVSSLSLLFVQGFQAMLDQPSSERERTLGANGQDRAEFQYEAGLAHRCDQDVWPCLTRQEEAINVCLCASNIWGLVKVLVKKIGINFTLAFVRFDTPVDPQPPYFSDIAFLPALPCARS